MKTNGYLVIKLERQILSFFNSYKLMVRTLMLCRLFDRLHQQHNPTCTTKRLNHFGAVEYMAKDLVDEEFDSASDYDTETSLHSSPVVSVTNSMQAISNAGSNQYYERPESNAEILPSIEELTKSMQDLTERDLISVTDEEGCIKKEACDELRLSQKESKSKSCSPASLFLNTNDNNSNTNSCEEYTRHTVEPNIISPYDTSMESNTISNDTDTTSSAVTSKQLNEYNSVKNLNEISNDMLHVKDIPGHSNPDNKISSLQNEIEGFLAPLSGNDVLGDKNDGDNRTGKSCHNEFTIKHALELRSKEYSDKDLSKRHCVTPSNTEESMVDTFVDASKNVVSSGSFIQGEKRARIGSCSNSSSTCSSSPFELCDTEEGAIITEHAIIESSPSGIR